MRLANVDSAACGAITRGQPESWSRHGRGPASFRHRPGIRFRTIRDLPSHFPSAGAKLAEPGDNTDRSGITYPWGQNPLAGSAGRGHGQETGAMRGLGGLVNGHSGGMRKRVARALLGVASAVMGAGLVARGASATPSGEAEAAMM